MAYMTRLGLWGPGTEFKDFKSFSKEISEAGVGAMEMVAMEMKGRGIYCRYYFLLSYIYIYIYPYSRYLSFEGTTFDILKHSLDAKEAAMYDQAVKYVGIFSFFIYCYSPFSSCSLLYFLLIFFSFLLSKISIECGTTF
jgi:P-loop containing NTP hydrolase pore-1